MEKLFYYVNSANRDATGINKDCHFNYTFNNEIDSGDWKEVVLLEATIPKSYYLVQNAYNTFTLREPGAADATITIPPGNYSRSSFLTMLPPILNTGSPHGWVYTMSYPDASSSANTGKFTYSVSGNGGNQPSFIMNSNSQIREQLGFPANSTNTFVGNSLVSANVFKF